MMLESPVLNRRAAAVCRDYFQLDVSMRQLVHEWSLGDERMAAIARSIPGMRILRCGLLVNLVAQAGHGSDGVAHMPHPAPRACSSRLPLCRAAKTQPSAS